ncbi:MAG: alpha-galactosidase [Chloroflexi bacterium]|nr:alpha-galactosidase [Chloroflexota bacterium]
MTKITFIGAGSLGFTRGLVRDLLTFPLLQDATITLMDIDQERLDFAYAASKRIIEMGNYPAKLEATRDRAEALKDADAVVVTILANGVHIWRHDIEIPKKYGVDTNIGDTRGPSGIFRALRTIPVMIDIIKDMEKYCPNAVMLNYTNPMVLLCRAMQRSSTIPLVGLCHSVQGTAEMLAEWIGAPMNEITYTCAGINHQAWFLKYDWNHKDAIPLIREAVNKPEIYQKELVRNEMFLHLDHYVTESSGHNSEYNAWFRKRPDLIEKYCLHGTNWNPGEYSYIISRYLEREGAWRDEAKEWLAKDEPISLKRGHEYAAYILNALKGGDTFSFNGNVRNTSLITNLPQDACVEVPVYVDRNGFRPVHIGNLPPQLAALNQVNSMIEEMTVEGCLTGDPRMIFHAILHDPLTAAVCSMAEIKSMVNEMFEKNRDYLPTFKHFTV